MLYEGKERDYNDFEKYMEVDTENINLLEKIDKEAKKKGDILHRILTFPVGDGRAIYQIVEVNDKIATLKVCLNIGDEWVEPVLGEIGEMPIEKVVSFLKGRDRIDDLFGRS